MPVIRLMKRYAHIAIAMLTAFSAALAAHASDPPEAASPRAMRADWPQYQRDAQRTGHSPERLEPPFKTCWHYDFISPGRGVQHVHPSVQPIAADGKILIATKEGVLHAFDLQTGGVAWTKQLSGPALGTAAASDNAVVAATMSGSVESYAIADGRLNWRFQAGPGVRFGAHLLLHDGKIIAPARRGLVHALEAETGRLLWTRDLGAPIMQGAAANAGRMFIGTEEMFVFALDIADGNVLWRGARAAGASFRDYCPVVSKGKVVLRSMPAAINPSETDLAKEEFPKELRGFDWPAPERLKELQAIFREGKIPPEMNESQAKWIERYSLAPYLKTMFVFDEQTGAETIVFHTHCGTMCGPVQPGAVADDGNLVMNTAFMGYPGVLDLDSGRLIRIFPEPRHTSMETWSISIAGGVILKYHVRAGWEGGFVHDMETSMLFIDKNPSRCPFFNHCTQGGGWAPPAIADGKFFYVAANRLIVEAPAENR